MGIDAHTITDDLDVSTLRPTQDHVLVRVFEKDRTSGGLHLARNANATTCMIGEIVSLGPGIWDDVLARYRPWDLRTGDLVLGMNYSGERMEAVDAPKYRIIRSHGLWAKVELKSRESLEVADLQPRMQCVLVEPQDETMWKGIYLANGLSESSNRRGRVVATGPGPWREGTDHRDPVAVSPGQQVAFMRAAGAEVEVNGKWLRVMVEEDIRGILEGME